MVVCNTTIVPVVQASCAVTPASFQSFPPGLCPASGTVQCNQRYPTRTVMSTGPAVFAPCPLPSLRTSPVLQVSPTSSESLPLDNSVITCRVVPTQNGLITTSLVPTQNGVITSSLMPGQNGVFTPGLLPAQNGVITSSLMPAQNGVITSSLMPGQNGVITSGLVPCTTSIPSLVPLNNGVSTGPYSPTLPTATLMPCNSGKFQCNPASGIFQCNPTPTSIPSVFQCNQGIYTCNPVIPCYQRLVNGTTVLQCAPGMCQMQPGAVLQGTVEMCPITTPPPVIPHSPGIYPLSPLLPPLPPNLCGATADIPWRQSYGMEQVWQCEFKNLFRHYSNHLWYLLPVVTKPTGMWNANVDSAKVRFCCEDCGHGWTSMKGRVGFWFFLHPTTGEGLVCLKLYGQQCDRCKTGKYEPAMWYPEEVQKVLVNIYNRVGQVYYGFQQAPYHKARRAGKPRTPHNSELCQACKDGVCSERR